MFTKLFSWFRTLFLAISSSSSLIEKKNSSVAYKEVEKSRNQILAENEKNEKALWSALSVIIHDRGFRESAISYGGKDPRKLGEIRLYFYLLSLPNLNLATFQWSEGGFREVWYASCSSNRQNSEIFVERNGVWKLHPSVGYGSFIGIKVRFDFPWLPSVTLELEIKGESEVRS